MGKETAEILKRVFLDELNSSRWRHELGMTESEWEEFRNWSFEGTSPEHGESEFFSIGKGWLYLKRADPDIFRNGEQTQQSRTSVSGARWWEYLALALPCKAREEIFENLVDEVKGDWIEFKARCDCPIRLRIAACFLGVRVMWYFVSTICTASRRGLLGVLREFFLS